MQLVQDRGSALVATSDSMRGAKCNDNHVLLVMLLCSTDAQKARNLLPRKATSAVATAVCAYRRGTTRLRFSTSKMLPAWTRTRCTFQPLLSSQLVNVSLLELALTFQALFNEPAF